MTNAEKRKRHNDYNRKNAPTKLAAKSLKSMQEEREEQRFMVRTRLAKRDLDYAASPCAARVTVDCVRTTDGRTLVVETRGRSCIGCMSAGVIRSA